MESTNEIPFVVGRVSTMNIAAAAPIASTTTHRTTSKLSPQISRTHQQQQQQVHGIDEPTTTNNNNNNNKLIVPIQLIQNFMKVFTDIGIKDDRKLKCILEINEQLECLVVDDENIYKIFLEYLMPIFLQILEDGQHHYIMENPIQQIRKHILDIINRLPPTELLNPYIPKLLTITYRLIQTDNEENGLICLRIIMVVLKQYRPEFQSDVIDLLTFIQTIYKNISQQFPIAYQSNLMPIHRMNELNDADINLLLLEAFTITPLHIDRDGREKITYNLIPKTCISLKILQEVTISILSLYQFYKQNEYLVQVISKFVPLILNVILIEIGPLHKNASTVSKELYIEFIATQVKTISFLTYLSRIYKNEMVGHEANIAKGLLNLLQYCPKESANLRRELLVITRHNLLTDVKYAFVQSIDMIFDEELLIGRGYTAYEALRPLACATLADFVHYVRPRLGMNTIRKAIYLFSKYLHDATLPISVQAMCCTIIMNLIDGVITHSEYETNTARDLAVTMLKIITLKFRTIAKLQLTTTNIPQNCKMKKFEVNSTGVNQQLSQKGDRIENIGGGGGAAAVSNDGNTIDLIAKYNVNNKLAKVNIIEYRSFVKKLVYAVKAITWGIINCKSPLTDPSSNSNRSLFNASEILIFIDLIHYALEVFDIFSCNVSTTAGTATTSTSAAGSITNVLMKEEKALIKEEKEIIEQFMGIFNQMSGQHFQEIFNKTIDSIIERIHKNKSLNLIIAYFLDNELMPPILITMLIEYLLKNMDKIGSKMERSHLHLNLFKSIFCSVANYSTENEHTLRPHLHKIINQSMELAMTSTEPYNYFLLLRAMFRAICDGRHELLYQEFLPLLPIVLEKLNRLQSNCHKQYMKDILLELCLTLPVRVSSLLPYLPMLMDVIIPSINSPNDIIITKGLQSLALCVETLQTDFLQDHIQPVRAEIIQLLWQKLRCDDSIAQKAFRLFAKIGSVNRKVLHEPQKLTHANGFDTKVRPSICIHFEKYQSHNDNSFIRLDLPIDKIILMSLKALRSTTTTDIYYKKQSWNILRCYLATAITFDNDHTLIKQLYLHGSFTMGSISEIPITKGDYQKLANYRTHVHALTGMFMAVTIKELTDSVLPIMTSLLRHYTMVSVAQTAGPFRLAGLADVRKFKIQPTVLVDAIAIAMAHEDKELCRPGYIAMRLILNIAIVIVGDRERASRLPIMQYLGECMIELCYERSWYAKRGGCIALKFLYQNMSDRWMYTNLLDFLKAYQFIIADLTDEIGCGTGDLARQYLEKMLEMFMGRLSSSDDDDSDNTANNCELLMMMMMIKRKAQYDVVHELIRQIVSPNGLIREQSMAALHLIARLQMKSVSEIMELHRDLLNELIPPKKYLLRHQPATIQIAIMDSNTFCATLKPRLFSLDINDNHHKQFFHELVTISELDDNLLNKIECYKNITNLIPLRTSALRTLSTMHYIIDPICRDKIICTLLKSLEKPNEELQEVAFECLKQFTSMASSSMVENQYINNVLSALKIELEKGDLYNLSIYVLRRVLYLAKLFPLTVLEGATSDHLIIALKKCLEKSIQSNKNRNFFTTFKNSDLERKLLIIFDLLREMSSNRITVKFIEVLCNLVMHTELCIMIESHSPFREPLVGFLVNYPNEILEILLKDDYVKVARWNRFTLYLLKHTESTAIRNAIQQCEINRLLNLILGNPFSNAASIPQSSTTLIAFEDRYEAQYLAVSIMELLMEIDDQWINSQLDLVNALKTIWKNDLFKTCDIYPTCDLWHKIGKILLKYFSFNVDEIDLLFMLLNAFKYDFIPDFQFLRDFLQNTIAQTYPIEWKRNAFFKFINCYVQSEVAEDLKAKIITSILMPCFAVSFERGHGDELIGTTPLPHEEDDNNIVSVYISKVINPDKPFSNDDFLRVAIFQMACLFVECASKHIHDGRKLQGNRLRRLMTYSWPCLLAKNYVDAAARYHGLLLMSHIITRFAINERIVLQVFHSLLRGYGVEARSVVRASLEILTPVVPLRVEDGNKMLIHWTKKIIVEEGHILQHLYHVLLVVVHHSKVYYPVRHQLIPHMVQSIKRLGFSQSSSLDYRKLSIELCETIVKWEVQRAKNEQYKIIHQEDQVNLKCENIIINDDPPEQQTIPVLSDELTTTNSNNNTSSIGNLNSLEFNNQQSQQQQHKINNEKFCCIPIDINAYNIIINHLIKLACQVNNDNANTAAATTTAGNSGSGQQQQQATGQSSSSSSSSSPVTNSLSHENLSQRCYLVIELAMKSQGICKRELYDLKLSWMDSLIILQNNNNNNEQSASNIKSSSINYGNICTAIELLTFFIQILNENQLEKIFTDVQQFLIQCSKSINCRIIRCMYNFLTTVMGTFPIGNVIIKTMTNQNWICNSSNISNSSNSIDILYETVIKLIVCGIEERSQQQLQRPVSETTQTSLYGVLMMMKSICNNYLQFIDRFFIQFMRLMSHLFREYLKPQSIGPDRSVNNSGTNEMGTNSNTTTTTTTTTTTNTNQNQNHTTNDKDVLELLILSIDLIKPRINVMPIELRKYLLNGINNLIEDTQDSLMIKSIIKICDYWMKSDVNKNQRQTNDNDGNYSNIENKRMLNVDELAMLLQKLILHINRRFPNDFELITGYLNLIHYIYTESYYSNDNQLTAIMETAFLYGLRFKDYRLRNKFIEIYDESIKRCVYTRLLYIIGTKSWDSIGQTYWMKQCIELLLLCVVRSTALVNVVNFDNVTNLTKLPNILSIIIANHHSNNNNNSLGNEYFSMDDKQMIMDYLNNVEDEWGGGGNGDGDTQEDDEQMEKNQIDDESFNNDSDDNKMECDNNGKESITIDDDDDDDDDHILLDWPVNDNLVVIVNEDVKKIEKNRRNTQLSRMIDKHFKFYDEMNKIQTSEFILATIQLLHMDDNNQNNNNNNNNNHNINGCGDGDADPSMNELCESLWIDLFPQLWSTAFTGDQRNHLQLEIIQFLANGTYQMVPQQPQQQQQHQQHHQQQTNCSYTSAIHTFVEAFHHCQEHPIELPANLMIYLSKSHNLWHRMTLQLENSILKTEESNNNNNENNNHQRYNVNNKDESIVEDVEEEDDDDDDDDDYADVNDDNAMITNNNNSIVNSVHNIYVEPLSEIYSELGEEDLWSALWLKHAKYSQTNSAVALEQMGVYENAQEKYELAMQSYKQDINNGLGSNARLTGKMMCEIRLWETHWIRCAKILNQWDILLDYAQSQPREKKFSLIMDGAWRTLNWPLLKSAIAIVEQSHMSEANKYKTNLYKGYLAILHEKDITTVDRCVRVATSICIGEWRRLPSIISNVHIGVLQATQQIMDLDEACQFRQIAQNLPQIHPSSVHDIKATVKKWSNRLPTIADDYSYWNDILTFRQQVYDIFTNLSDGEPDSASLKMINVHASAQSFIALAKVARKHNLFAECEHMLLSVSRLPSVPLLDCFQKICQQVKCYLTVASMYDESALDEALDKLQQTNYRQFQPEMIAEFLAIKGNLLALTGKSDEANQSFAESVEHCDTSTKAWELWGNYLENLFIKLEPKQLHFAEQSIICFLLACRQQNEIKSRKYLAKVLWLLSYDDASCTLMKAFDKYILGISQLHWVPWIPQLASCVVQYDSTVIVNLLTQIGRLYPQAVYFPIRTMYITLKHDHRERHKIAEQKQQQQQQQQQKQQPQQEQPKLNENSQSTITPSQSDQSQPITIINPEQIPATPSMWRCSKVMQMQREIHSTVLSPLESIIDQMACFRENWYEEIYQLLRYTLHKCYTIGFENRQAINRLTLTVPIIAIIKKILIIYRNSMENINNYGIQLQELFNRALFKEFQCDFNMGVNESGAGGGRRMDNRMDSYELIDFIELLTKWSNAFEARIDHLPKSFIMGEKFRFLLNFTRQSADIELPGELLQPNQSHYHKRIAKFMPRVDIIRRNNCSPRCLHIRGTNGKMYPYLIMHETFMDATAASEERVLQLFRTLNYSFGRHKETAKRYLNIHVPKVISVSPQIRIVEHNQSALTLFDIFKGYCRQNSVNLNSDLPINWYFKRLSNLQKNYNNIDYNLVLNEIYQEIQLKYASKLMLKQWTIKNYPCAVQYWQFRKMFTVQYALACLCEHVFYLTNLRADQLCVHQDSGLLNVSYFKFNIVDMSTDRVRTSDDGPLIASETTTATVVPFRLTPNIEEFLSPFNITGPYTVSVIAAARALLHNNVQLDALLRTILHNEFIDQLKRKKIKYDREIERDATGHIIEPTIDLSETIPKVYKSVENITDKLYNISLNDGDATTTHQFSQLISVAMNKNILSKMDPQWHAWL